MSISLLTDVGPMLALLLVCIAVSASIIGKLRVVHAQQKRRQVNGKSYVTYRDFRRAAKRTDGKQS